MVENNSDIKKTAESKRESLQDIINAVAEKEDVISAFHGTKKTVPLNDTPHFGLKYLLWNLLGGLFFGLGLLVMVLLAAWLLSNFNEVRAVLGFFGKFVNQLKALGR